jgi:hypothetical protein
VVLGDGAPWIWHHAEKHFSDAVQIVDRFHAKQHFSDVAQALYEATSELAPACARQRHDELDRGETDTLLATVAGHAAQCAEARTCVDYLKTNRHRMQYPDFHAQGFCTSSGVVEAGCKMAIGTGLKRAGMHWTVAGANAIIARRCRKLEVILKSVEF